MPTLTAGAIADSLRRRMALMVRPGLTATAGLRSAPLYPHAIYLDGESYAMLMMGSRQYLFPPSPGHGGLMEFDGVPVYRVDTQGQGRQHIEVRGEREPRKCSR